MAEGASMAVDSPCTKICAIDPASGLCRGCLRNLDEIARWGSADDSWRRGVLDRLPSRRGLVRPD
jgi:predicted Fe-S protein YdhL (DUF1289 family)